MRQTAKALLAGSIVAVVPALAHAHVEVASGPATAASTQDVTFGVGHGCEGADTYRIDMDIPAGVGSIRPLTSDFGKTSVEKDAAGNVTKVSWQKADSAVLPADTEYYKLVVRLRPPAAPFTTVYFRILQTCRAADGTILTTDWAGKPGDPPLPDGGTAEPAAGLRIVPARLPGWNKYTVPAALSTADLATWFGNAAIVWKGSAAYSANPSTVELIKTTAGVTQLDSLQANDEIWVKY